jgi:hypothetical protein
MTAITCLIVVILPLHLDGIALVVHDRQTLRDSETALIVNVPHGKSYRLFQINIAVQACQRPQDHHRACLPDLHSGWNRCGRIIESLGRTDAAGFGN